MDQIKLDIQDHTSIAARAVLCTLGAIVATLVLDYPSLSTRSGELLAQSIRSDLMIPTIIALPSFYVLFWKIRQLAKMKAQLLILANTDGLTGALNHRAFVARASQRIAQNSNVGIALLVADVDHFKQVNDRFGHLKGDEALSMIADAIRSVLGEGAEFGRLGGEEFAILLPEIRPELARLKAEQIRLAVESSCLETGGVPYTITISIGVSLQGSNFEERYRDADRRLYEAKHTGRNRVVVAPIDPAAPARQSA